MDADRNPGKGGMLFLRLQAVLPYDSFTSLAAIGAHQRHHPSGRSAQHDSSCRQNPSHKRGRMPAPFGLEGVSLPTRLQHLGISQFPAGRRIWICQAHPTLLIILIEAARSPVVDTAGTSVIPAAHRGSPAAGDVVTAAAHRGKRAAGFVAQPAAH